MSILSIFGSEAYSPPDLSISGGQQYTFRYKHRHWVAGMETQHDTQGDITIGISTYAGNREKWSLRMTNVVFDWSLAEALPEFYFSLYAFQSIECFIDAEGQLTGSFHVLSQDDFIRHLKKEIDSQVKDIDRARSVKKLADEVFRNPDFVSATLIRHPVVSMLIRLKLLTDNLPADNEENTHTLIQQDYWSADIDLPLYCRWFRKQEAADDLVTYARVGGPDSTNWDPGRFRELLQQLTGSVMTGGDPQIDFSEAFVLPDSGDPDVTQLRYGESILETIVPEVWYKKEEIVISRKEVSHG